MMEQRTPNFTPAEKECLFNLVAQYADVLEDKLTNRTSIKQKQLIWQNISAEFNIRAPIVCRRTAEQLRRLYENKKKDVRKKSAEYKRQSFLTGGGPPPEVKWDPTDEIVMQIMNTKTIEGVNSPYDSDSVGLVNQSNDSEEKELAEERIYEFTPSVINKNIEVSFDGELEEEIINKRPYLKKKCPPEGLQRPISDELRNSKPMPSCSSLSNTLVEAHSHENIGPSPAKKLKNRRRPQAGVKTLTSSDISEKYNILLDRRLVLVEKQIEQANTEQSSICEMQKQKMKLLKSQEETSNLEKEEKRIKIELLKLEVTYKRTLLSNI